jgi:hypothetical protein
VHCPENVGRIVFLPSRTFLARSIQRRYSLRTVSHIMRAACALTDSHRIRALIHRQKQSKSTSARFLCADVDMATAWWRKLVGSGAEAVGEGRAPSIDVRVG